MNRLTVSLQQSILTLHDRGWSARRIARELDIHRETVGAELKRSKPAKVTAGSEATDPAKPAKVTTGSRSQCEPHRGVIEAAILQGLSAQRIYQDLQTDHAYTGGYESVKRFVRALAAVTRCRSGDWKPHLANKCRWTSARVPRWSSLAKSAGRTCSGRP